MRNTAKPSPAHEFYAHRARTRGKPNARRTCSAYVARRTHTRVTLECGRWLCINRARARFLRTSGWFSFVFHWFSFVCVCACGQRDSFRFPLSLEASFQLGSYDVLGICVILLGFACALLWFSVVPLWCCSPNRVRARVSRASGWFHWFFIGSPLCSLAFVCHGFASFIFSSKLHFNWIPLGFHCSLLFFFGVSPASNGFPWFLFGDV